MINVFLVSNVLVVFLGFFRFLFCRFGSNRYFFVELVDLFESKIFGFVDEEVDEGNV